jgi:hypothetical protein
LFFTGLIQIGVDLIPRFSRVQEITDFFQFLLADPIGKSKQKRRKKTEAAAAGLALARRASGVERARLPARLGARRLPASYGPAHWFGRSVIKKKQKKRTRASHRHVSRSGLADRGHRALALVLVASGLRSLQIREKKR